MFRTLAVLAAAALLAGCGSLADPISEDTTAGRTAAVADFSEDGTLQRVEWKDGKDKASVAARLDLSDGSFEYEASDVRATEPAQVRAAMMEAWGEDTVDAIEAAVPGGLEGLVDALGAAGVF